MLLKKLYTPIDKLTYFYSNLKDLSKGYIKDKEQLEKSLDIIKEWQNTAEQLDSIIRQN